MQLSKQIRSRCRAERAATFGKGEPHPQVRAGGVE